LTIDEGALVIGLLDCLVDPRIARLPDVVGLADRTRKRVAGAVAAAITAASHPPEVEAARSEAALHATAELSDLVRRAGDLVGESGQVAIPATDRRLRALRADLASVADVA
jgi:hypothetical protein